MYTVEEIRRTPAGLRFLLSDLEKSQVLVVCSPSRNLVATEAEFKQVLREWFCGSNQGV